MMSVCIAAWTCVEPSLVLQIIPSNGYHLWDLPLDNKILISILITCVCLQLSCTILVKRVEDAGLRPALGVCTIQ